MAKKRKISIENDNGLLYRVFGWFSNLIYDINVKLFPRKHKQEKMGKLKNSRLLFFYGLIALPFAWWLFGYLYSNIRSILYIFQGYDAQKGGYYFNNFENFGHVISDIKNTVWFPTAIKNGVIASLIGFPVSALSIFVSYYVYKKFRFWAGFKLLLYMPQIISSIVLVVIYKYFVDTVYPYVVMRTQHKEVLGLLANQNTQFWAMLFFHHFFSFGNGVIMWVSYMSGTDESLIEACKLDGCNAVQEFFHVVFPHIYGMWVVYNMGILTGFLSANIHQFTFYGYNLETRNYTMGYFMQREISMANPLRFPYVATLSFLFSCVTIPVIFVTRKYLIKLGPTED